MRTVELGQLIEPAVVRKAGSGEFPVLSMTMHSGLVDQSVKFNKRVASADTTDYKVIERGQLVVGFPIDEGVLDFQNSYDEAIVSPAYGVWQLRSSESADSSYLARFLRSPRALSYYKAKLRGSTARRRSLPKGVFLELKVPLPTIEEQRRVAVILDHVDALRFRRRQVMTRLNDLKQSIFINAFGDPARNPRGLPMGTVGDLVASADYGTSEKSSLTGDIAVLRMNNITYGGDVDLRDLKYMTLPRGKFDRYTVRSGDVLFNRTNSAELVGKTAVYRDSDPIAYAGYLVRLRVDEHHQPDYLSGVLNSGYGKATLRGMCKRIVGMANINAREVQTIRVPIPSSADQEAYAHHLAAVRRQLADQANGLLKLEELFASLQSRAFSGQL
ncbi:restriction endonuclease subunit S [Mycobacterium spongiae]|uniref:Type I restriction modification DNA specificity domain-containing protein n=1 Tax=Mycobacterium spongiae TaxID=886343 RepID=A0A975JU47_9MYCO|nr:restriction endonuclease subunit S [Mycobacterium spongiae]QUR65691.1 hypothetical protein F6B93_00130 [Mycobacterium spongiae]